MANDGGEIAQVAAKQRLLEILSLFRKTNCIKILTLNELIVLHWEAEEAHRVNIILMEQHHTIGI